MTELPPTAPTRPSRRAVPGRSFAILAVLAVAVVVAGFAGCGTLRPTPSSPPPSSTSADPSVEPASLAGLLVAAWGSLQVTDADGRLAAVDGLAGPTVEVAAAHGVAVAVDQQAAYRISDQSGSGIRSWHLVALPGDRRPSRLIGLAPDARTLAVAIGALQSRPFDLVLLDLASGRERSIEVARGLDGPPIWIGTSIVAVHAILDNQRSGFTFVDVPTGAASDVPSYGVALAASADGSRVAFDDAKTGEVLVGRRADMNDAGLALTTRLANGSGSGVEHVALSADGRRLAIVRRTDGATAIELLVEAGAAWRPAGAITIPGDGPVSIAWLG